VTGVFFRGRTDTFGWPKARCTFPAFVTRSSWRDLAGSRVYRANDMGDSIVIKFTSALSAATATPPARWSRPRQQQQPQLQRQQLVGQWQPATLLLCHSILEANATSDFFVAEAFVLDGWSVPRFLHLFMLPLVIPFSISFLPFFRFVFDVCFSPKKCTLTGCRTSTLIFNSFFIRILFS